MSYKQTNKTNPQKRKAATTEKGISPHSQASKVNKIEGLLTKSYLSPPPESMLLCDLRSFLHAEWLFIAATKLLI